MDPNTILPPSPTPSRCDTPLSYISVTPSIATEDVIFDGVEVDVDLEFDNPKCSFCEKTFSSKSNRNKHMKKMHRTQSGGKRIRLEEDVEKDPDIYPFFCGESLKNDQGFMVGVCHESFKILKSLEFHKGKTHYKMVQDCKECGKIFREKTDLHKHEERVHKKKKNYVCQKPSCNKSFFSAQEFQRHSKTCKRKYDVKPQAKTRFILPNYALLSTNGEIFKSPQAPPPSTKCELPKAFLDGNTNETPPHNESQNIPPNCGSEKSSLHQDFDWYSFVAKHKTNRFGLVPLPPGPAPETLGTDLKMDQKGKQEWRIELPQKEAGGSEMVFIDMETYVYTKHNEAPAKE